MLDGIDTPVLNQLCTPLGILVCNITVLFDKACVTAAPSFTKVNNQREGLCVTIDSHRTLIFWIVESDLDCLIDHLCLNEVQHCQIVQNSTLPFIIHADKCHESHQKTRIEICYTLQVRFRLRILKFK